MESLLNNRVTLAHLPTPINYYPKISKYLGIELFVKRDDLTESIASGNKIRKIEYVLYKAKKQGADTLVTCGGLQSNHCRAVAWTAAKMGLHCTLILRNDHTHESCLNDLQGNLLVDYLLGAKIQVFSHEKFNHMDVLKNSICSHLIDRGQKPYFIPMGASNATGSLGYVRMIQELVKKKVEYEHIYCAVGSGGKLAGIMLGCQYFKRLEKIHGIPVCENSTYFFKELSRIQTEFKNEYDLALDISGCNTILDDNYKGIGYALNTEKELKILIQLAQQEGLLLDPVYSLKAFIGLIAHIEKGIIKKGDRVLFVHTGGHYGIFPKADALKTLLY